MTGVQTCALSILPGLTDLASGKVTVTDFQDLDIEDLLGRAPVAPDLPLMQQHIAGQVVLVTGAGGSIGASCAAN